MKLPFQHHAPSRLREYLESDSLWLTNRVSANKNNVLSCLDKTRIIDACR